MRRAFFTPILTLIAVGGLFLALAFSNSAAHAQTPDATPTVTVLGEESAAIPGRLIVGMDPSPAFGVESMQAAGALAALDAQVINATDPCVANAGAAGNTGGQTAVQSWQVAPGAEEEAMALLAEQPGVRFVLRDVYMYAAQDEFVEPATAGATELAGEAPYTVNDPLYTSRQWGPQRANFARAWQLLPPNSALTPIRVAVIDSGVDFDHPDLAGRLLPGKNYVDANALPVDDNGHGTHVAGIIAAITNNGVGMAGSAPQVLIDPRKVLDDDGNGSALNLRYALCDAARDGANVANMSVQIALSPTQPLYTLLKEAMDFAEARGMLLVAAGGNNRFTHQVYYPALFEEVVAVASLTIDNRRPDYGPIGPKVEIAAPGGDASNTVLSTWPSAASARAHCGEPLQSGGSWYCGEAGTSMASPHVAGGAALVWSAQPSLTAAEVRSILSATAVDVGLPAEEQGAGLLNVEGAVRWLTRSNLHVTLNGANQSVAYGSAPYTATLLLSNPSLEPLSVSATITGGSWLSAPSAGESSFAGSAVYGQPLAVPVVISPTHLVTGTYTGQIQLAATRRDGSLIRSTATVFVGVGSPLPKQLVFPLVMVYAEPQSSSDNISFSWETPISPTIHAMTNSESVDVFLPFAFPLAGPAGASAPGYAQARIHADGFVTFPDVATNAILDPGQNRCLPWSPGGLQGVFGWWADLNAAASGAQISSFSPGADRFVIQYEDLASVGVTPAYQVAFQIVLFRNGDVQLNYQKTPPSWSPGFGQLLPYVTIGVQARNGLYRNQVACASGSTHLGVLPQAGLSLRIKSGEVY